MRRTSFEDMDCSVAQTVEVVGEWWTPLIVRDLLLGIRRFERLQERLGIARNVLTDRLNRLVDHGIVVRVPYQTHPLRHEYRLTDKGRDLWLVISAIRQWGDRWAAPDGMPLDVIHDGCGGHVEVVARCESCDAQVGIRDVRAYPTRGTSVGA